MASLYIFFWIGNAFIEGVIQGYLYHYRNTSSAPKNENLHLAYGTIRLMILSLMIYGLKESAWMELCFAVGLVLIFSFFHNGSYYRTRNILDSAVYPKRWWDSSSTSKAFLEFAVKTRLILLGLGIASLTLSYFV